MKKKQLTTLVFGLLINDVMHAEQITNIDNHHLSTWHVNEWTPRITTQGLLSKEQFAGFADGMLPLLGKEDQLIYLDGSLMGGRYNSAVSSIGAGIRQIPKMKNTELILGGFIFAEYQQIQNSKPVWFANPGFELLTRFQELRIQGYLPLNQRSQPYRSLMASDIPQAVINDSGKVNNLSSLSGHGISNTPVSLTHEYGQGIEGEIGQYLPLFRGAWLRGGLYHFNYKNAQAINGVEANIELFTNKNLAILVQDNYDNQNKNTFSVGLRFSFGGPNETDTSRLSNRMETPIIRHLARQPSGLATPIRDSFIATGPTQTTGDIWFFSPQGTQQNTITLASCTAENPCLNLDQTVADGITSLTTGANLWFATGTYTLPSTGTDGIVYLGNGQKLYGRSLDFRNTAQGTSRPLINGGLVWEGGGYFNDMQIRNTAQIDTDGEVSALKASTVLNVNRSNIYAQGTPVTQGINASQIILTNSQINTLTTGAEENRGVYGINKVLIENTTISSTATGTGRVLATAVEDNSIIVHNSQITALNTGTGSARGVYGVGVSGFVKVEVTDSVIRTTSNLHSLGIDDYGTVEAARTTIIAKGKNGFINGIYANNGVTASDMSIYAYNGGTNQALAIVVDNGLLKIEDSVLRAVAPIDSAVTLANNNGDVISNRNRISAQGSGTFVINGIFASNNITVNDSIISTTATGSVNNFAVISDFGFIKLTHTSVNALGNASVYGVSSGVGNILSINSTVNARSTSSSALDSTNGILAANGNITFQGIGSHISATSMFNTDAVLAGGTINNNSTPKSKCSINGGAESDCA